jgi:hypothetical protein
MIGDLPVAKTKNHIGENYTIGTRESPMIMETLT